MSSFLARYPVAGIIRESGNGDKQTHSVEVGALQSQLTNRSDEALLIGCCNGDQTALTCLFRRYARLVRSIGYRVIRDEAEADDLLQEVFVLILNKSGTFDASKNSARSWIVQIAYHRAIDRRRHLESRRFYQSVDIDEAENELRAVDGSTPLEDRLDAKELARLLEDLSENQRTTLTLFFFEGYTFDEIAGKLGQTRGNIKNHYFRGLERLRKRMQEGISRENSGV